MTGETWHFTNDGKSASVRPSGPLRVNNGDAMMPALLAGIGLGILPEFILREALFDSFYFEFTAGSIDVLAEHHGLFTGGASMIERRPFRATELSRRNLVAGSAAAIITVVGSA